LLPRLVHVVHVEGEVGTLLRPKLDAEPLRLWGTFTNTGARDGPPRLLNTLGVRVSRPTVADAQKRRAGRRGRV
jgi:hypothetical protein